MLLNSFILTRLSSRNRRSCAASRGDRAAIACSIRPTSGVACEFAAGAEDEVVLRIEPDHRDLGVEVPADGGEDRFQHPRIEEERRAEVKAKAVLADRRGSPADPRLALEHGDLVSGPGQQHGAGKAARARSDDDNPFRSGHGSC